MDVVESLKKENQRFAPLMTFMALSTFRMNALRTWPHWQLFLIFIILKISILISINDKLGEAIKEPSRTSVLYLCISISLNLLLIYTIIDISIGLNYLYALITCVILFTSFLIVIKKNLSKTTKISERSKIVVLISTLIVLLFTSTPLIQPINNKPKIDGYFYPYVFYFQNKSHIEEGYVFVKQSRGFSWNLNLTVADPKFFDVYLDNRINGNIEWKYMKQSEERKIPIQIFCPSFIEKGVYIVELNVAYLDYLGISNFENLTLAVYVEVEVPPPAEFPWLLQLISTIIAMVVLSFYMQHQQRKKKDQ